MSAAAVLLQSLLRRLVLRLVLLLDRRLAAREAWLASRLETLPPGHRHRAAFQAELDRLARVRDTINHPDNADDPRFRGMLAEVARVRNDPGRRALARRRIYPWLFFALPEARPAPRAHLHAPDGRSTTCIIAP